MSALFTIYKYQLIFFFFTVSFYISAQIHFSFSLLLKIKLRFDKTVAVQSNMPYFLSCSANEPLAFEV